MAKIKLKNKIKINNKINTNLNGEHNPLQSVKTQRKQEGFKKNSVKRPVGDGVEVSSGVKEQLQQKINPPPEFKSDFMDPQEQVTS